MTLKLAYFNEVLVLILICLSLLLIISSCKSKGKNHRDKSSFSDIKTGVYLKEVYKTKKGDLNYRILYPENFDVNKKYPVLLFLHGAGERGDDNEAQLVHGGDLIKAGMNLHQSIAILPQCPEEDYWVELLDVEERPDGIRNFEPDVDSPPSQALAKVIRLMRSFRKNDFVDKSKIYVSGLSMGGMATFDLCWRMPKMFAAANVICGAGSPIKAKDFSKLPIRIFHGEIDEVVAVDESKIMIEALQNAGGNPEVFLYQNVNHNSWENAFDEPDFLSWLYNKEKK